MYEATVELTQAFIQNNLKTEYKIFSDKSPVDELFDDFSTNENNVKKIEYFTPKK